MSGLRRRANVCHFLEVRPGRVVEAHRCLATDATFSIAEPRGRIGGLSRDAALIRGPMFLSQPNRTSRWKLLRRTYADRHDLAAVEVCVSLLLLDEYSASISS